MSIPSALAPVGTMDPLTSAPSSRIGSGPSASDGATRVCSVKEKGRTTRTALWPRSGRVASARHKGGTSYDDSAALNTYQRIW